MLVALILKNNGQRARAKTKFVTAVTAASERSLSQFSHEKAPEKNNNNKNSTKGKTIQ